MGNGGEWGMRIFSRKTSTHRRRNRGGSGGTYPIPLLKNSGRVPL